MPSFVAYFLDSYKYADLLFSFFFFFDSVSCFIFRQREFPECHLVHPAGWTLLHQV